MEYLALYRKYRPKDLDEVVGQSEIKKILASSVSNGTITHAYLFSGPRGTGKTTMAKILAKMVNCESPVDGNACNKCHSCLEILNSNDVIEIDAASNNGVDEIRDLREKANLVPTNAKYKVYIIDEVHMLTTQAFNALLKTLEEPPKHVIFILATTEYYKIPLTITSRCQKFQFNKISIDDIVDRLKKISELENISIDDESLVEIAKISDGGMRDSINFLDQLRSVSNNNISLNDVYDVCGNVSMQDIVDLLNNVHDGNIEYVVNFFEKIDENGKNYNKFFEDIICFFKDIVLYKKNVNQKYLKNQIDYIVNVANNYDLSDVLFFIDELNEILCDIKNYSRQSVYVVSKFLLIMNKINNFVDNNDDISSMKPEDKVDNKVSKIIVVDNSASSDHDEVNNNVNESVNVKEEKLVDSSFFNKNKEIIINNAFALASKELKNDLQQKFTTFNNYLTDTKYKKAAGIFIDITLEVAGKGYLILSTDNEAVISKVELEFKKCSAFINDVLGDNYLFAVITRDEWNKYRDEFIANVKNNKKYEIKEIDNTTDDVEKEEKVNSKSTTVVDKLFSLVGENLIERK